MSLRLSSLAVAAACLCSTGSIAQAATVQLNTTLNLSTAAVGSNFVAWSTPGSPSFAFADEDALTWTVDFVGDQYATFGTVTGTSISAASPDGTPFFNSVRENVKVELLGSNGQALAQYILQSVGAAQSSCCGLVFSLFSSSPPMFGAPISFYGLRFSTTRINFISGSSPATASMTQLLLNGSAISLTIPAAVPEPATWALLIGGFGAAGAMLRRRRALLAEVC